MKKNVEKYFIESVLTKESFLSSSVTAGLKTFTKGIYKTLKPIAAPKGGKLGLKGRMLNEGKENLVLGGIAAPIAGYKLTAGAPKKKMLTHKRYKI